MVRSRFLGKTVQKRQATYLKKRKPRRSRSSPGLVRYCGSLRLRASLRRRPEGLWGTVSDLKVSMGLGRTTVILPDEGTFYAKIEGAIGETVVVIPAGMAARIRVDTGLTVSDLPDSYRQRDDVYTSPDYASADDRVDLEVSQAIGKITIHQSGTW